MQSIPLFIEEGLATLKKALKKAEEEDSTGGDASQHQRKTPFPDVSSSDDENSVSLDGAEDSSTSNSIDETSTSEDGGLDEVPRSQDSLQQKANTGSKAKPKRETHARIRRQQVYRCKKNLPTIRISLNDNEELVVPTPLLDREDILGSRTQPRCLSLVRLATQIVEGGQPIVILLLRSGRFAGGVFQRGECVAHRCFQRYTIRKGQGKAQSAQDSQKKAQSMGSQLRRAGEQSLKEDISSTLMEWDHFFRRASLIFVSCPNTLKSTIFTPDVKGYLTRKDSRIRKIPFDVGRPTFDSVSLVYEVMLTIDVDVVATVHLEDNSPAEVQDLEEGTKPGYTRDESLANKTHEKTEMPLGSLHVAARDGDLTAILEHLSNDLDSIVDQRAGADFMTPLHFAAQSAPSVGAATAASCVCSLLLQCGANPCLRDGRLRLPYYLGTNEKVREAFRQARAILGEDSWDWEDAKVGPALADGDLQLRKEREAEKKRRKKARQKEKKAKDSAQKGELEQRQKEEAERRQREDEAKRTRDSLLPKASNQANICDFCLTECKGRKRQQMFFRLDYSYCSADCVQKHKRELMASAALARFGG
jgi:hypothetical protein